MSEFNTPTKIGPQGQLLGREGNQWREVVLRECVQCGKLFYVRTKILKKGGNRGMACSPPCRNKMIGKRKRAATPRKRCPACHLWFKRTDRSWQAKVKTCGSRECSREMLSRSQTASWARRRA